MIIISIICALVMGLISRWHGGGFFTAPKVFKNAAWGIAIALAVVYHLQNSMNDFNLILTGILVATACAIGKATPNRQFMDMGMKLSYIANPNIFDPILIPVFGRDPRTSPAFARIQYEPLRVIGVMTAYGRQKIFARCAAGMAISGLAAVAGAVVALSWFNGSLACLIAIAGAFKGASYMIGWDVYPNGPGSGPDDMNEPNELAEFLTGFWVGAALCMV